MIGGLPYATWTRLTIHLTPTERAYAAELLSLALESDKHLPANPIQLARLARATSLAAFRTAWKKLTEPPEGFEPVFQLTSPTGGGYYCPAQISTIVENLCKTQPEPTAPAPPARAPRRTAPAEQPAQYRLDGPVTAPPVPDVPTAQLPDELATIGRTPFPTYGLPDACFYALALIVAFWRKRAEDVDLIELQAGMPHATFNEAIFQTANDYGFAQNDPVIAELWSPKFWKSRPELVVTPKTIAPSMAIFEGLR